LYGDFELIAAEGSTYIYKRKYFDDEIYVYFNNSNKVLNVVLGKNITGRNYMLNFNSNIGEQGTIAEDGTIITNFALAIKPFSFEIITVK